MLLYGNLPPSFDGGADYIIELAEFLSEEHEVILPTLNNINESTKSRLQMSGIKVLPIAHSWDFRSILGLKRSLSEIYTKYSIEKIILVYPSARRNKEGRYFVPLSILLAKKLRNFDLVWFKPFPVRPSFLEIITAIITPFMAKVIVSHEQLYVDLGRKIPRIGKRVFWSPFGETVRYKKGNSSIKNPILRKSNVIGFMGYWYKSKGLHILLDAFEEIMRNNDSNYSLLLIGGRSPKNFQTEYEKKQWERIQKSEFSDYIIHAPEVSEEELSELLNTINCYVLPYTFMFTSRSSLSPAVNLGLPTIISSPNKNQSGFLKHSEHAHLVKPKKKRELVASILKVCEEEGYGIKLSQNISKLKSLYSWDSLIKTLKSEGNDFY